MSTCRTFGLILLAGLAGAASPVDAQIVRGIVIGVGDGAPISNAQLVLRNDQDVVVATATSASNGRFVLSPRGAGSVRLEVTHLGYADWDTAPFELGSNQLLEVEVKLGVEAIPLDPLTVVAESSLALGTLAGFRERMADPSLNGYYVLPEEIERRPVARPSDLLLSAPGISVGLANDASGFDRGVILAGGCPARTFIDGIRVDQVGGASVDDLLSTDRIAGVEVYPRAVGAPVQYQDPGRRCGVVLFWTKPAEADEEGRGGKGRILLGVGLLVGILGLVVIG